MSCQSLTARAFVETDKDSMTQCGGTFHRSVRFSSESRASTRSRDNDLEIRRETPESSSISMTALPITPMTSHSFMSQSAPSASVTFDLDETEAPPAASCRFPKLEECAHFHYERVSLGGLNVQVVANEENTNDWDPTEGWVTLTVSSHVTDSQHAQSDWTLNRNSHHFKQLDEMLHRCIYDRKVSGLPNLSDKISPSLLSDAAEYTRLIADYMHHLSIIADDVINCGPVLNWLQCDNKGHKLLVSNEDSSSINTPAVAAAYSVRKYVSQARDEISFEVGDMISVIDMPAAGESEWWRGKRGFRVGFFPGSCVCVIGDKAPRHMPRPPPLLGSVAVTPIKPVLRKHGKLISLFRSFILSRPSRRSLKQQGILRERVFGCDLGEHLMNCGDEVPVVVVSCASYIEAAGAVDGIYRLSGGAGLTQRLRALYDAGRLPGPPPGPSGPSSGPSGPPAPDPHAVASLLKMYFRELPNPLCTYQLYDSFVRSIQAGDEVAKLKAVRETVVKLPPPHYRTLSYLMRHLRRVSALGARTGMTARNMAIVWAPNLLRSAAPHHALQGVAEQAVVTEFLICFAEELFSQEQGADSSIDSFDTEQDKLDSIVELRGNESCRRPKSLPINPPTKLLSLEEARRRGGLSTSIVQSPRLPAPSGVIAAAAGIILKPHTHNTTYIEVGSGPNNLPQYHTVLDRPLGKRGLKRSPSGWRGLFARNKQRPRATPVTIGPAVTSPPCELRPVKSCESLSECDTLAPLADTQPQPLKQHTRSSSCDSYFEPWQAELADMRLRLSPQERDHHMFSEEDDTQQRGANDSLCSSPAESGLCSVEPSPRRNLRVDIEAAERARLSLEEQLSSLHYIDGESPLARRPDKAGKRTSQPGHHPDPDHSKRVCKDRESPASSLSDFPTALPTVKLRCQYLTGDRKARERSSPRKARNSSRYSGMHQPIDTVVHSRLSWHGKDGHSTLIKIDWPIDNSISNLTNSTLNSSPITPTTPNYDQLEESPVENKHTIKIESNNCQNCDEKCLKCELKATDYENVKYLETHLNDSFEHIEVSPSDISYQNLNRLSAVSSSNSELSDRKKDDVAKVMTSSHESSSGYSNASKQDEAYESYNFKRPNYINLSSSTSKSSPESPLKSPLKSTISITFRSPSKTNEDYETLSNSETPKNERDSIYEDVDLEKNLSIVEEASVPEIDASLPTQQAYQPDFNKDLIILESPVGQDVSVDIYSQVKFFKKSIDEVNAMVLEEDEESPNRDRHYENVGFEADSEQDNKLINDKCESLIDRSESSHKLVDTNDSENISLVNDVETELVTKGENQDEIQEFGIENFTQNEFPNRDYENINVNTLNICDKLDENQLNDSKVTKTVEDVDLKTQKVIEKDNGNTIKPKSNFNVRELAIRFESPTEQKGPFVFEKFKAEIKYPSLERKDEDKIIIRKNSIKIAPPVSPKTYKLSRNCNNARSLDENAFIKEFGPDRTYPDRRKSLEVRDVKSKTKFMPDLNLNLEEHEKTEEEKTESITPTTENKISLIQYDKDDTRDIKKIIGFETEKKLSRERIEKYKEERRNFLREKYSSQSFRSNTEQLTRLKLKKEDINIQEESLKELPKFERRNTVDLGQRMRFSLAKSANDIDSMQSPTSEKDVDLMNKSPGRSREFDRKEKISPSYNIRDMTALFELKSQNTNTG